MLSFWRGKIMKKILNDDNFATLFYGIYAYSGVLYLLM